MPAFTAYPTQGYRARVSTYWWLGRRAYLKFILREISSVFVAWFVLLIIFHIRALGRGPEAYARMQHYLQNPLVVGLNVISFFFVVFHAITWFNLAPKAMAIRMGGKRVPGIMISGPNYIVWIVVSAAVAWLLLRG